MGLQKEYMMNTTCMINMQLSIRKPLTLVTIACNSMPIEVLLKRPYARPENPKPRIKHY